ncbi:MAG: putative acid phosphatase SurE [Candidatus Methanohalarchaeum thermophilum]|uniref:5'-nucleotidase SurE n=1 Tax=Methanohalarchaeum thermophilum TaxID=1903181 RepID=A0A1Q6DUK3_METT1|nr:MAG: putative acid phosphatase SurE [Candidatus Methanohalarchaeum thermophilum]
MLTNDDGIYSTGIKAAYNALSGDYDTTIVAPSTQKSGIGRAISLFEPIRVSEVNTLDTKAYSVGGTPTDSVILGLYSILEEDPDLVVSGINLGENLSTEAVTTSGTIGAALEAATQGVPAISASVQLSDEGNKFHEGRIDVNLDLAKKNLLKLVNGIEKNGFPDEVDVLNLNVPNSVNEDTPVRITKLARKVYNTSVEKRKDPRGKPYFWIDGGHIKEVEKNTDVDTILNKEEISITPITLEMTSKRDLEKKDILY